MKILSNLSVSGLLGLNSVSDANTDTDKFLVLDSSGIVRYRTGAELYSDIGAGGVATYTSTLQHEVKAAVALTKGQAVYVSSADGTNMIVSKASNDSEATSSKTLGLIAQNLSVNGKGFVVTEGLLSGLDTSTAGTEGDPVWLGVDGNLIYGLTNKPYAPDHLVFIGIVTRKNASNGEIFVKVQNGFELQELHNVQITSTPADNTVLSYETSTGLYKMKSIPTLLGYTPVTNARTLTINGTSYNLTADRSWSVGTVTSIGTTGPITGGTITTSGTIGITQATTSTDGYLSSTDWNTFNNKQAALGFTPVTNARTLTINGTTYDLTSNRSWSVGTITGTGTSNYLAKWQSGSVIGDSLLYDTGSAVLIGTSTAGSGKFMVYSTTADNHYQAIGSAPSFRFADTITSPTYTGIIGLATASNHFIIGAAAGDMVLSNNTTSSLGNFLFGTGATERMRISPAGNVSINNTNNTYRFDVTGTVRFTGQLRLESTITNGTHTYTLPSGTGTLALTSDISYPVTSVFGRTGAVTAQSGDYTTAQVTESGNLYYTEARVNANANVAANTAARHNAVTIGTANGLSLSTQVLSLALASGSTTGALSSTDWTTFNNKQNALTNPVTGTGTTNYLPKFTGTSTIGNSVIHESASSNIGIGNTNDTYKLDVTGNIRSSETVLVGNGASQTELRINSLGGNNQGPFIRLQKAGSNKGYIGTYSAIISGTSDDLTYYATGSQQWMTNNSTTTKMLLDASGNLGLGVTPSAWGSPFSVFQLGTYGQYIAGQTNTADMKIGTNNYYSAGTFYYTVSGLAAARYDVGKDGFSWNIAPAGTANAGISFTQAMTLDASGKLGIGTTTPDTYGARLVSFASSGKQFTATNGVNADFDILCSSGVTTFGADTGTTAIKSAGTTRLTIASTGAATFSSSVTATQFIVGSGTTSSDVSVRYKTDTGDFSTINDRGSHAFGIYDHQVSSYRMYINTSGSVGIGTTSPSTLLHLNTSSTVGNIFRISNGTQELNIGVNNSSGGSFIFESTAQALRFGTSDTERMRITSGGAVLIGSTDGAYGTFVAASSNASGYTVASIRNMAGGAAFGVQGALLNFYGDYGYSSGVPTGFIKVISNEGGNNGNGAMTFGTHNGAGSTPERMRITSGGNVLIGTTTGDGYKLQIVGNSQASSTFGQTYSTVAAYSQWVNSSGAFVMGLDGAAGTTERMRISSGGDVLVNATATTQGAKFYVNGLGAFGSVYVGSLGTGTVYSNAGTLTNTNPSDIRLKNTIKPLTYGLNEVLQLNPKTFYYNDDATRARLKYGFIAQEVKEVMPDMVRLLGNEDYLGLEQEGIWVTLVNAIKEQNLQIKEQQAQINELKSQLNK